MRVLGIDPGIKHCGLAVIEEKDRGYEVRHSETLEPKEKSIGEELLFVYEGIKRVLTLYKPSLIAFESPPLSLIKKNKELFFVEGIIHLLGAETKVPVKGVLPTEVKKFLTGFGHSSKEELFKTLKVMGFSKVVKGLEDFKGDHHQVDAIVIALFGMICG